MMEEDIFIDWGPLDAIRDDLFSDRFTETPSLKSALANAKILITGEKGMGKSGLRRALVTTYGNRYAAICDLDFNAIIFDSIHHTVSELCAREKLPPLNVLSGLWASLLLYDMVAKTGAQPQFAAPCAKILKMIEDALPGVPLRRQDESLDGDAEGLAARMQSAANHFSRLASKLELGVEKFFAGDGADPGTQSRIAHDVVDSKTELKTMLNGLGSSERIKAAQNAFARLLESRNATVLLVADGLDRLQTGVDSRAGIQLMFEALMTAAYAISTNLELIKRWDIKLLIPYDRYLGARLRDMDKIEDIHHGISWNLPALREMVRRRLSIALDSKTSSFQHLWLQVFPQRITNLTYQVDEDSFEYIARHTMYRPRQLISLLQSITQDRQVGSVQKSHIVDAVRSVSKTLADSFVNEYAIEYPEFATFLELLKDESNVMKLEDLRALVSLARPVFTHDGLSLAVAVRKLFGMGFFGILRRADAADRGNGSYVPPTTHGGSEYVVDYFYKARRYDCIDNADHDDVVAVHPMFMHRAELRADPVRIVG